MIFKISDDKIEDIRVVGGCPGNSLGLVSMCKGKAIAEVISVLKGIKCGSKSTSCPDQIAIALLEYQKHN